MVITLDLFAQNLYQVIKKTGVKTVILHSVFGLEKKIPLEAGDPPPQLFQEIMASAPSAEEPAVQVSSGDVAVLQYTSGSTGSPKAATLTHANIVASVLQSDAWMGMKSAGNAAVMCVIPFFHVFGMSACLLISVLKGYRMVLLPRIDPNGYPLPDENQWRPTGPFPSRPCPACGRPSCLFRRRRPGSAFFDPGGDQRRGTPAALGP